MNLDLREIASIALDEWEKDNADVTDQDTAVSDSFVEATALIMDVCGMINAAIRENDIARIDPRRVKMAENAWYFTSGTSHGLAIDDVPCKEALEYLRKAISSIQSSRDNGYKNEVYEPPRDLPRFLNFDYEKVLKNAEVGFGSNVEMPKREWIEKAQKDTDKLKGGVSAYTRDPITNEPTTVGTSSGDTPGRKDATPTSDVKEQSDVEDAFGIKLPGLGGGSKAPSANPPKPAEAPKGPKKMGASETAQAQAMAGKSQSEQAQSLQEHDAVYHKKKPYDPATSTCTLRQKLVETQKAMGAPITEEQAQQMRISKKDLDAGNQAGGEKADAAESGAEGADPMLTEIRDLRKKAQGMSGEERAKADADIQAKCVEFAKKNLGEAQGEAVEGLFNKIKVAGADMAQKIKDAFAKRDESKMSDAQKEVKDAIVEKADEVTGTEGTEVTEGSDNPPENPVDNPDEGVKVTLHTNQPSGSPDGQQAQALADAISEVDPEQYNDELSDYDKDVRRTEIANRAARYLDDWSDLDDPDKRAAAVEAAINDIERAKADGTKIQAAPNEAFQSDVNPPPEKRWTEEGLNSRINEIDEELLKDGADTEKLFDEREALAKKLKDGDFDAPSKADYRAKMLKAMKDKKSAETNLQAAKDAEASAKTKDEKEAAANAVTQAKEALEKADDALTDAKIELENYEEPQKKETQQTGEPASGSGGETGSYETQIDGKTYVDLDKIEKEQGFAASLAAAAKAGWNGDQIVTSWDKMTGRWNHIAGAAANQQQRKDVDNLARAVANPMYLLRLKKKAASEKDPDLKRIYEQCVAMSESGVDITKVIDHENKMRESLRKGKDASEMNAAKVAKEQANVANIKGREESRVAEEKRRDEKLQMAKDKEEDRKRHQKFQEDMAKAKDEYKRAQDAKKELPDTAAKMNPGVVKAITDARDNCKDPVKRGELDQVLINLENTRDPGKALQWQNKADQIINGKSKNGGEGSNIEPAEVAGVNHDNGEYLSDGGAPKQSVGVNALDADTMTIDGKQYSSSTPTEASYSNIDNEKRYFDDAIGEELGIKGVDSEKTSDLMSTTLRFKLPKDKQVDIFAIKDSIAKAMTKAARAKDKNAPAVQGKDITNVDYDRTKGEVTYTVTNDKAAMIPFKSSVEHPSYKAVRDKNPGDIILPFGDGVNGKKRYLNLSKLKHLNIVGKTGGGKGMTARSFIGAIEAFYPNAKYMICDAAKNGADYLEVENSKRRIGELKGEDASSKNLAWAVNEMNNRNSSFAKGSNWMAHNAYANSPEGKAKGVKPMDPVIVICDEYAQLDKNSKANFKKLAKLARSSGIMLIAMTQHPDATEMDTQTQQSFGGMIVHKMGEKDDAITKVRGSGNQSGNGTYKYKGAFVDEDGTEVKTEDIKAKDNLDKYVSGQALSIGEGDLERLVKANDGNVPPTQPKPTGPTGGGSPAPAAAPASASATNKTPQKKSPQPVPPSGGGSKPAPASAPAAKPPTDTSAKPASTTTSSASPVKLSDKDFQDLGLKKIKSKGDVITLNDGAKLTLDFDSYKLSNGNIVLDYGNGTYRMFSRKKNESIKMNSDQVKKYVASGAKDPADFDLNSSADTKTTSAKKQDTDTSTQPKTSQSASQSAPSITTTSSPTTASEGAGRAPKMTKDDWLHMESKGMKLKTKAGTKNKFGMVHPTTTYSLPNGCTVYEHKDGEIRVWSDKQKSSVKLTPEQLRGFVDSGLKDPHDFIYQGK